MLWTLVHSQRIQYIKSALKVLHFCTGSSTNWLTPKVKDDLKVADAKITSRHRIGEYSLGRSMIEMLGVLAIVAVLSVGGIAGYSKAMRMWNSNIQRSQITQILHSLIHLRYELKDNQANSNSITPILNALGEIPAGMKYANGILSDKTGNHYSGNFGKNCWQESQDSDKKVCQSQMYLYVRLTKTESSLVPSSADLCENLVYVAKENSQDVISVTTFLGNSQDDDNPGWRGYHQNAVFNQKTIKTATPLQIKNMCRTCTNHGYCAVAIYLKTS